VGLTSIIFLNNFCYLISFILIIDFVMFRQPAARLRQIVSPLLKRGGTRARTGAEQTFRAEHLQRPFWNSGRVLLFSAVTGTTTYFYGANDDPHRIQLPWLKSSGPQYASKIEMENASCKSRFGRIPLILA
jgi:D-lactate dehydrogenase (cytochrome)